MLSRTVVGVALGTIFAFLGALHVFWAFGGTWGSAAAIAEIDGRPRFTPSRGATLAVAAALVSAALVVLVRADLILAFVPRWASQWAAGVLGAVFVLRALGDFRLMGFFKSVRGTRFAVRDTWLYSPLCLLLGVGAWWLAFG